MRGALQADDAVATGELTEDASRRGDFRLSKACWSGDAFGTMTWPVQAAVRVVPMSKRVAVDPRADRVSWSGAIFESPARARAPPSAEDLAREARRANVAVALRSCRRAPAPSMPRTAWSGDPFESAARARAPPSNPLFTNIVRKITALFAASTGSDTKPATSSGAANPPTNAEWRVACDKDGVVSWYDYGIRLG